MLTYQDVLCERNAMYGEDVVGGYFEVKFLHYIRYFVCQNHSFKKNLKKYMSVFFLKNA